MLLICNISIFALNVMTARAVSLHSKRIIPERAGLDSAYYGGISRSLVRVTLVAGRLSVWSMKLERRKPFYDTLYGHIKRITAWVRGGDYGGVFDCVLFFVIPPDPSGETTACE